jgi:tetratricopeptide (TPR) repeat protein
VTVASRAVIAVALACTCAVVRPARAQPEPSADGAAVEASAKAFFDAASKAYEAHDYTNAIENFKKAYALLPDALFLYDIAQSYRQLHDCDDARGYYRSYVRIAPTADNHDKAQRFLDEMEACSRDAHAGDVTTTTKPGGGSGAAVGGSSHAKANLRLAGIITGIAGVVGVGVGVFFSVDAANQASDLQAACAHGCNAGDVLPIDEAGRNAQTGAIISYLIGGAAIAAGVGMYLYSQRVEPVVVTPVPGGATVSTMVRF